MYNIKVPSKIVAKTARRGMPQKVDSFRDTYRHNSSERDPNDLMNGPRPVFQQTKKYNNNYIYRDRRDDYEITQEHEAIVQFIQESWNDDVRLNHEAKQSYYYQEVPSPALRDFKPFDLEAWWGRRLFLAVTDKPIDNN